MHNIEAQLLRQNQTWNHNLAVGYISNQQSSETVMVSTKKIDVPFMSIHPKVFIFQIKFAFKISLSAPTTGPSTYFTPAHFSPLTQ